MAEELKKEEGRVIHRAFSGVGLTEEKFFRPGYFRG
jgi:hypothetical protein